jgi:hypothetical protein
MMLYMLKSARTGLLRFAICAAVFGTPALALADDAPQPEARLQGYNMDVSLKSGSTALIWFSLVALGVVGVGVTFLSAKRSHLD